jgi:hypothetical protein
VTSRGTGDGQDRGSAKLIPPVLRLHARRFWNDERIDRELPVHVLEAIDHGAALERHLPAPKPPVTRTAVEATG